MCLGAQQNGLPEDYMKKLQAVKTNNYTGPSILDEIKKRKNWVCVGLKQNKTKLKQNHNLAWTVKVEDRKGA